MHHRIIDRLLIENERMESMVQELYTLETRDIQILQTVGCACPKCFLSMPCGCIQWSYM